MVSMRNLHDSMEIADVQAVLGVHRAGSFSSAARVFGVHQATLSRRVARAEAALATKLFVRVQDGARLTDAGRRVLQRFEAIEAEILAVSSELEASNPSPRGTVRVSAPDAFGSVVVAPLLAIFQQMNPETTVELVASNAIANLARREADVALRLGETKQAGLVRRRIATVVTTLFASEAYLARRGWPGPGLSGHDLVSFAEPFRPRAEMRWFEQHAAAAKVAFRSNSPHAQLYAALEGAGLALLPAYLARRHPSLVQVIPPERGVHRRLDVVTHKDLRDVPTVRAVIEFLALRLR
jgi:DNA-binding transcriptional LysR family regulator